MKRLFLLIGALVVLAIAGAIGYFIARRAAPTTATTAAAKSESKVLYWYDPMVPQQHFEHPGLSPMGMQMVPKYANGTGEAESGVVRIDPQVIENLGVRTTVVPVAALDETVRVPATVVWDQRESVTVSARVDATIDRLYVRAPFEIVHKGEPLADVLAPEWSAAAAEYRALAHANSTDARSLRAAALQRLRVLGMDAATIAGLRTGNPAIALRAPITGVVAKLQVTQGEQVAAGAPLMTLNALDHVWVEVDVPQAQMAGIAAGTPATVAVSALPGEAFSARVEDALPEVDPATRTQRVRIELANPQHALAPGMFAEVAIDVAATAAHPLVPDGALIATGNATRVIVAEGDGRFRAVPVRTGRSANGQTEILAGLSGGEHVVTSGQFLIDSEASLSGALQRLNTVDESSAKPEPPSGAARHPLPEREGNKSMQGMPMPASSGEPKGHRP
ncbi:MAG TPA: efflux RND transporter periplasmic adaptor subunit [Rhodanobacteraceae bacterium]|nr:efflux RND transporter periplasmic adaptor subunit [Rhodanobacteraceae bacterium]